jgi:hypothetical protein
VVPAELEHKVLRYSGDADLIVCDDIRGGTFSSLRCFSPSATSVGPEEPPAAVTKAASGSKKESEDRARVCEERSKSKKRKRSHSAQGRHDDKTKGRDHGDEKRKGRDQAEDGEDKWGLQLRFGLPPAAFATMLVREV